MTTTPLPAPAPQSPLPEADRARLHALLKRCPPEAFAAACAFAQSRSARDLAPLIRGVLARYVESGLRPKLAHPADNVRLRDDLGLDSLTLLEVVVLAEDVLGVSISNEELAQLGTVGDIQRFLAEKTRAA